MAENDTHYNGTADAGADSANVPVYPLTYMGGSSDANVPVIPLPNVGEGGPVYSPDDPDNGNDDSGNGGDGANVPVIPLPNPGEGGPVYSPDDYDSGDSGNSGWPNGGSGGSSSDTGGNGRPGSSGGSSGSGRPNSRPGSSGGSSGSGRPNSRPGGNGSSGDSGSSGGSSGSGRPNGNRPNGHRHDGQRPDGQRPGSLLPGFPVFPSYPSLTPQYYGQVRFLNASVNSFMVNISIDNTAYAINSGFGTLSGYDYVEDGFHTVTVRRATGPRSILLQQNFPFVANQKVTMVLTDSDSGGLEIVRVVDTGCSNIPAGSGCYRFANMSYSGSSYDLMLYNGETVFGNVGYQTVTSYKQAIAGSYQFYVTDSNTWSYIRELPIIVIGAIATGAGLRSPLVSFTADILAGRNYTSYLIGNTWSSQSLRVLTTED